MDVMKRQEQLDLKEKELNAREQELKQKQEQMIKDGILKPTKNWPKCFPITKHDIDGEVSHLDKDSLGARTQKSNQQSKEKDLAYQKPIILIPMQSSAAQNSQINEEQWSFI